MKNKMSILAVILLAACSKLDVSNPNPIVSSGSIDDAKERCATITHKPSKDVYPHTTYVVYADSGCDGQYGSKVIFCAANPDSARIKMLIKTVTYGNDYKDEGLRISGSADYFLNARQNGLYTYRVEGNRTYTDAQMNIQTVTSHSIIKSINDSVKIKTGNSDGSNILSDGSSFKWASRVQTPIKRVASWDYPISGENRVAITNEEGTHAEIINYGNGTRDYNATITIYKTNGNIDTTYTVTGKINFYGEYVPD